jgi:hypothetical protein
MPQLVRPWLQADNAIFFGAATGLTIGLAYHETLSVDGLTETRAISDRIRRKFSLQEICGSSLRGDGEKFPQTPVPSMNFS